MKRQRHKGKATAAKSWLRSSPQQQQQKEQAPVLKPLRKRIWHCRSQQDGKHQQIQKQNQQTGTKLPLLLEVGRPPGK
jgi:hypothetical protein